MQEQMIAAVATPLGTGGIGIIRLSGQGVFETADKLIRLINDKKVSDMKGYTCAYGRVYDQEGEIDEAIISVFRAPHSYTGEDVVEIAAHGGVYLLERILRVCCEQGAHLAQAGEFTRRAFLNGKLDLTQAEAIIDLISAQGKQAARAALSARDGALYQCVQQINEKLTGLAAHLAAWIDYPEEEIIEVDEQELSEGLNDCKKQLQTLLMTYDAGKIYREGIETAIVGRPNVGKSTLMNLLAGYDRSIVADIAGTTRDVVSDTVRLGDLVLHISDTAGIRCSDDPIEQAGVRMAERHMERAQLVLAVFDGSEPLGEDDLRVIQGCDGAACIALVNKNDLPQQLDLEMLKQHFSDVISLSAKSREGRDALVQRISELFALGQFDSGAAVLANERQHTAIQTAGAEVTEAISALESGVSYDAVCVCIENAVDRLLELTGSRASQEVVDQVFARFCVGK